MTIRNKLLVSFAATSIVILLCVGLLVFRSFSQHTVDSFSATAQGQLERIDDIINVHLTSAAKAVDSIAQDQLFRQGMGRFEDYSVTSKSTWVARDTVNPYSQQAYDVFDQLNRVNPLFVSIYVGYADSGHAVFPAMDMPGGYSPPQRAWYKDASNAKNDISYTQPYVSSDGSVVISVMAKIYDMRRAFVGVASVDFALTGLTSTMNALRVGKTGYAVVIDGNDNIIVDPMDRSSIGKSAASHSLFKNIAATSASDSFFEAEMNGTTYLVQARQSPETGWKLGVIQKKSDVLEEPYAILLGIGLAGIGILLAVFAVAFFISRSIAAPINRLVVASEEIAKGNFNAMPEARLFTGDLGSLHGSLNAMTNNLRQFIENAQQQTALAEEQKQQVVTALENAKEAEKRAEQARREGIAQAAGRLDTIVNTVIRSVNEINHRLAETRHDVGKQLSLVTNTAAAMEEMNASISEVSRGAESASDDAQQARKETGSGVDTMKEVVLSVKDVMTQAQHTQTSLGDLGKQAELIGQVMTVISDIADQTNLLALNAAIEAARAGDAGRGFAVVADEVRKLAENTMRATSEVDASVKGVQRTTQESISRMQEAEHSIERTIGKVAETEQCLTGIQHAIDSTTDKIVSIATAARQQTVASEQVTHGTAETSTMLAGNTENITACADLVVALHHTVKELHTIIEDLQK